jgi:hypothetical protein
MGGMIATEIANKFKPAACILLSSAPTHKHMPGYFKWAYILNLHKMVPISLLQKISILKRGLAPDNDEDKNLLRQVIKDSDPQFIRWAMNAILLWKNEEVPAALWHIHGNRDGALESKMQAEGLNLLAISVAIMPPIDRPTMANGSVVSMFSAIL